MTKLFDEARDKKPALAPGAGIFGLIVLSGFFWFFFAGGREQIATIAKPCLKSWLSPELYSRLYPDEPLKLPSPLSDPLVKDILRTDWKDKKAPPGQTEDTSGTINPGPPARDPVAGTGSP